MTLPFFGNQQTAIGKLEIMATQTQRLESIGHICATLQKPYGVIRRTLADVGAEPAVVLNGVAHYAEADVERVAERLEAKARARGGQ